MKRAGFFDVEEWLAWLSVSGDQLEAFFWTVDSEVFRLGMQAFIPFSSRASLNQSASYPRSLSIHCAAGRLSSKAAAPV